MIALEYDEIQPDPALKNIESYFTAKHHLTELPDLFDRSFSKQDFEKFDSLLS